MKQLLIRGIFSLAEVVFSREVELKQSPWSDLCQGRAVGVVAGASRAFGQRTQGVWGAAPHPLEASSAVIKL